ncbi:FMN-binding protein [Streptomyces sp. NPDC053741]|uniref:FMN-binding protein n=1 Tax=[Kitasatospora] papulosa TaxID=1464011 RepID=A0ABZ1JVE9_9ACTN|nr:MULTISPECIES: FMN-binding protein [Streptomyces]MCX4417450.1 FMN-binding protein [[Kitasatospora] papulosa]MEE1775267.1 FMN-binding protein [Streptomyces sp. JV181]MYT58053.1 FMN-binding protein [Streptomyces sp. SID7834]
MRRAVLVGTGSSALVVALLALKPHQIPGPDTSAARSPVPSHTSTGASTGTGTYTGDPVDTRYGTVQVAVTVTDGRITAVKVIQAPDQNGRDQQISSQALPQLTQEAIKAQSAHIDAVSGASYTSQGYAQSLQSALDQAHV